MAPKHKCSTFWASDSTWSRTTCCRRRRSSTRVHKIFNMEHRMEFCTDKATAEAIMGISRSTVSMPKSSAAWKLRRLERAKRPSSGSTASSSMPSRPCSDSGGQQPGVQCPPHLLEGTVVRVALFQTFLPPCLCESLRGRVFPSLVNHALGLCRQSLPRPLQHELGFRQLFPRVNCTSIARNNMWAMTASQQTRAADPRTS